MSTTTCPNCDEEYKNINRHWSACGYPQLSKQQKEILIGGLMGDATIDNRDGKRNRNPRWILVNTNPEYATYVNEQLQPFSNIHQYDREYKNQYRVRITHPRITNLTSWYETGKKVFPDIDLTPTILKHWYACDGHKDLNDRFTIAVENEKDNGDKLKRMFSREGMYVSVASGQIYANKGHNSNKIFNYMGEPVKGFEYKWP